MQINVRRPWAFCTPREALVVGALVFAGLSSSPARARADEPAPVTSAVSVPKDAWAVVGSSTITRDEVERRRRLLGVLSGDPNLPTKVILEGILNERVVVDHLDRDGTGVAGLSPADLKAGRADLDQMLTAPPAEVDKKLKDAGLEAELDLLLRVSAALKKRVERDATDEALKAEFDRRQLLLCDGQVRVRQIVVAIKEGDALALSRAQQVLSAVKTDGSNVEAIARRVSDDPIAALTGGDTDFFGPNPAEWRAVRPEVLRAVFEQGKVGLVPQPVKARDGYHVVYVTEVRVLGDTSYE